MECSSIRKRTHRATARCTTGELQERAGGALERKARSGALHAAASKRMSRGSGAASGNATGGIDAPTALESSAQAKHLSHVVLPGVESC
jgi:hypothetical protein